MHRFVAVVFTMLLAAAPAWAALADLGWKLLELPDKVPARFALLPDGSIEVASAGSVAFLYREAAGGLNARWRWRVDKAGPASDPAAKGRDDRPLAVHIWFPDEAVRSGLRGLLAEMLGYPSYGRVLTYMWAAGEAKGRRFASPYFNPGQGAVVVLRDSSDGLGEWHDETVNIAADYRAAFGAEPVAPSYVALSADSDDLGGMTLGRVADLDLY